MNVLTFLYWSHKYKRQILAFELFAITKVGKNYLTERAQKGFELKSVYIKKR